jgi:hypothetical protein
MPENLKTPGVYIAEKDSGANAIVQVSSAVPVFIGYTERASINGKSFHMKPVQINSLSEFAIFFGGAPKPVFTVKKTDRANSDVNIDGIDGFVEQDVRADLVRGVHRIPEVSHDLLHVCQPLDLALAVLLANAEDDDAAVRVGERTVRRPEVCGNTTPCPLELYGGILALRDKSLYPFTLHFDFLL